MIYLAPRALVVWSTFLFRFGRFRIYLKIYLFQNRKNSYGKPPNLCWRKKGPL